MQPQHPIATWNPEADRWETPEVDIFGHSVAYSETLPKSGMTRNGRLYERPTSVPPTTGHGCSSSPHLPTPQASNGNGGKAGSHVGGTRPSGAKRAIELTDLPKMLPTPTASDGEKERNNPSQARRKSPPLSAVNHLLPQTSAPTAPLFDMEE